MHVLVGVQVALHVQRCVRSILDESLVTLTGDLPSDNICLAVDLIKDEHDVDRDVLVIVRHVVDGIEEVATKSVEAVYDTVVFDVVGYLHRAHI